MSTQRSKPYSNLAIVLALLAAVASVGFIAWNAANNPMDGRRAALESRLRKLRFEPVDLPQLDQTPRKESRDAIVRKAALWKGLIDAPVAAAAAPDLAELLKGVIATRQQVVRAGKVNAKIKFGPEDTRGQWIGVGDTVRDLAVKEIRSDAVVFSLTQGGREYTAELRRQ